MMLHKLVRPLVVLMSVVLMSVVTVMVQLGSAKSLATCEPNLNWSEQTARISTEEEFRIELGRPPGCHFHSLAWQWFLHLLHPVSTDEGFRNFEDTSRYFVLGDINNRCEECDKKELAGYSSNRRELSGWFIRTPKIPTRDPQTGLYSFFEAGLNKSAQMSICDQGDATTDQPGPGKELFDKFGKVVFYRVYYHRSFCAIYGHGGPHPSERLLETKFSWRQIEDAEKHAYVHRLQDLPGLGKRLVGIVGVHIAREVPGHGGLIWATFEHKRNAADCQKLATASSWKPTDDDGWSFTTAACAKCLKTRSLAACGRIGKPCDNINKGPSRTDKLTHICRLNPSGGADRENQADIARLNDRFVGDRGLLATLPPTHPMEVLSNYFHVGTLWLVPHGDPERPGHQKGSLQLANTTLESFQQHKNCFACHTPKVGEIEPYPVSFIYPRGPASGRRP